MVKLFTDAKKRELAIRFFSYGIMVFATIGLTTLAIFYALGYRINQQDFSISRGGLLQFHAFPENATVIVDGQTKNFRTPGRLNVNAGAHSVEMRLEGYKSWSKEINVLPGQLLWLNYTRFVPEQIQTNSLREFDNLHSAMPSPGRRWLVLQEKPTSSSFVVGDFENTDNPKFTTVSVPESALTKVGGKLGRFSIVEWDLSAKFLLIRHTNKKVDEFIRVEVAKPTQAVNITKLFSLNIDRARFAGSSANIVYARTKGDLTLRKLNIGSKSASAALATGVRYFEVYGGDDEVAFTAVRNQDGVSTQVVGVLDRDGEETVLRNLPPSSDVNISFTEYFNKKYMAVASGQSTVDILAASSDGAQGAAILATLNLGEQIRWVDFSDNGRMLVAGSDNKFVSYDLETADAYSGNEKSSALGKLVWLDDFHFITTNDNKLKMIEFDGKNEQEIAAVQSGFTAGLSRNGELMLSINKNNSGKFVLQASTMVID